MARRLTWRRATEGVPPDRYASDAVDQHAEAWCGACYLVAAAQMVQDRAHVALARARGARVPPPRVSLQTLMDHFRERDVGPGWNACHGGFPEHVLQCLADGTCPLVMERGKRERWWGFARVTTRCPRADAPFRVSEPRRVMPWDVRAALADGPVVLEVSATTLKRLDARGVARDLTPREPDHAVCVVGWETLVNGVECWIVRNSWGRARVPQSVPTDVDTCVARGRNDCAVAWEAWKGDPRDPGFLLLPISYAPLHALAPSPWLVADVTPL